MDSNMSGETLPAIRSSHSSPGPLPSISHNNNGNTQSGSTNTSGNGNGTKGFSENNNMGVTLPPIHSLMGRSSTNSSRTVEHAHHSHGHGHGDGTYRQSTPEQHQQLYMRKRANEPALDHHGRPIAGRDASGSPPANKRRRVDVEPSERNGNHSGSESMRHHHRNISSSASIPQQQQQDNMRSRHSHEPPRIQPAPTSSSTGLPKQEVISPPAVLVQSPATPSVHNNVTPTSSTVAISDPPASFSRRISNSASSPSTGRPTPRKLPPSRLNFQSSSGGHAGGGGGAGHSLHASLSAVPPSIRSAPPIPVHRDGPGPMQMQQMQMHSRLAPLASSSITSGSGSHDTAARGGARGDSGSWLTSRAPIQSRATHPPPHGAQGAPASHTHSRSHSLHQAATQQQIHAAPSDSATPRASTFARDRDGWPTVPTPTSLRLGSRPIVPPPLYRDSQAAQSPGPGVTRFPTTPSARGHAYPSGGGGGGGHGTPSAGRFPPTPGLGAGAARTPAVLSPIPPLGQAHHGHGHGGRNEAVDKSKFMQKMSEMYDFAGRSNSAGTHHAQRDCGCLSSEEVDRRFRERDVEIGMLRNALSGLGREILALRELLNGSPAAAITAGGRVDGDGDVSMAAEKVASISTAPTAGDMEVDTRSGNPANQVVSNGDVISLKHHRPVPSRGHTSIPGAAVALEKSTSNVPIPPAIPFIPKVPVAPLNGKAASRTASPSSTREDTPTAGMNGVEAPLKPSGKSGDVGESEEEAMKA